METTNLGTYLNPKITFYQLVWLATDRKESSRRKELGKAVGSGAGRLRSSLIAFRIHWFVKERMLAESSDALLCDSTYFLRNSICVFFFRIMYVIRMWKRLKQKR